MKRNIQKTNSKLMSTELKVLMITKVRDQDQEKIKSKLVMAQKMDMVLRKECQNFQRKVIHFLRLSSTILEKMINMKKKNKKT